MIPIAVARLYSDSSVIRYVLPVLWMTSCFHIMQGIGHNHQVSSAADKPARRGASHQPCCTQMSMVSVINWWPRPSLVYYNDRPPKLTAPESISRSRDMVCDHQNLNGSRDLTTLLSKMVCYH